MKIKIVISILSIFLVLSQIVLIPKSITKLNEPSRDALNNQIKTKSNPWLEYRRKWNEEVLININMKSKEIQFIDEYRNKMRGKGLHPLNIKHARLLERFMRMERYCKALPLLNNGIYDVGIGYYDVLFNDKFELLQCMVQKVSSSTWVDIFIKMLGSNTLIKTAYIPASHQIWNNISLVNNLELNITAKRYQTYTKFIITRNPFERLLSAYKNKFTQGQKWYEETIGPRIIKDNYFYNISNDKMEEIKAELRRGENNLSTYLSSSKLLQLKRMDAGVNKLNITFLEFLNYVISQSKTFGRERLDYHWAPITSICNPCAIKYDILAKFETLSEDSQAILDYVQTKEFDKSINFPKQKPMVNSKECRKEFEKIPIEVKTSLYQIFREDFLIFGYQHNELRNLFC